MNGSIHPSGAGAALSGLRVAAPPSLAARTLVAVGLADEYTILATPIGPVYIAWNGRGLSAVDVAPSDAAFEARLRELTGRPVRRVDEPPARLGRSVARRLAGDRRARVRIDVRGRSEFERAVWAKALEIPRGEVRPYSWVAAEIGRPRAVRAVGSALGRNPVPLVVPCHRVVRSNGTIGQYGLGGPANKRRLLVVEGVDLDGLGSLGSAGIRYIGSDTTHIFCLPTCHNTRRIGPRHRVPFRSAAEGVTAGYRACRECRPASAA
jgi:O-6-methylguanine DNA methyltransferase